MDVNPHDVGAYLATEAITVDNDATAASTGDNTEVDGAEIDMIDYDSGKIVIGFKTTLTASETLKFRVDVDDATTTGGDYGSQTTIHALTLAATGAKTGYEGTLEFDFDPAGYSRFVKFHITPDLSAGSADTVTWGAYWVGLKKSVS